MCRTKYNNSHMTKLVVFIPCRVGIDLDGKLFMYKIDCIDYYKYIYISIPRMQSFPTNLCIFIKIFQNVDFVVTQVGGILQ